MEEQREPGRDLDADVSEILDGFVGRDEPPYYSAEIEPAIRALYKLHERGWFWRLDSVPSGIICTIQRLTEDPKKVKDPKRQTYQIGARSLPLAISLVVLKTK